MCIRDSPSGGFEATVGIGLVTPGVFTMEGTLTMQSNAMAIDVKAWLLGESINKSLAQGSGVVAVSYTHLEVYKRQQRPRRN